MKKQIQFFLLWVIFVCSCNLFDCRSLDVYEFPVYITDSCPRNHEERIERSSVINCSEDFGYMCIPNKELTELLEFCYRHSFIWIQEGHCSYFDQSSSKVDRIICQHFLSGCPKSAYMSSKLFECKSYSCNLTNACILLLHVLIKSNSVWFISYFDWFFCGSIVIVDPKFVQI